MFWLMEVREAPVRDKNKRRHRNRKKKKKKNKRTLRKSRLSQPPCKLPWERKEGRKGTREGNRSAKERRDWSRVG